jgi:enediyne biosynthesis protein E4
MKPNPTRRDFLKCAVAAASLGCAPALPASALQPIRYVEATSPAHIRFNHYTGAFGKYYLPETMGSGCAFIDYNNDSLPDIFLVQSTHFPGRAGPHVTSKLYRNNGNGIFTDVSARSGLDVQMYGMGAAVGDYDNDGWDDLYMTGVGESKLFHNNHNGTFTDVTRHAGVNNTGFGTSAAWFDYDRDGLLDLFVCNYVNWSDKTDIFCSLDGRRKTYCTPEAYPGETCRLFHNLGKGRFEDVTGKAGIYDPTGKNLGVAILDYNGDGWPDIAVSNDTQPSKLYRNNRNGTFTEVGVQAGIAFSEDGIARGAMGIDAGDFDDSGRFSLLEGNFSNQMLGLYHNDGRDFIDIAPSTTVGRTSLLSLSFGLFFFDYDLDGLEDFFVANGHIAPDIHAAQPQVTYREVPLVYHNEGHDRFHSVGRQLGFTQPMVGRGAAYADTRNRGRQDILLTTNGGPAHLYENIGDIGNHALRIKTVGTKSNRDGIGALIRVHTSHGVSEKNVHSGSSYCSQSELTLTFGMDKEDQADHVEISWPSGHQDTLKSLKAGFTYTVQEGGKILSAMPFQS